MTCTVILAVFTLGSCNGLAGNDELDRYFQRSDTIVLSAGDAVQANAVTQIIHPWPHYVGDRRIVVSAAKLERSMTRYRSGTQPRDPLPATLVPGLPLGAAGATAANTDAGAFDSLGGTGAYAVGGSGAGPALGAGR